MSKFPRNQAPEFPYFFQAWILAKYLFLVFYCAFNFLYLALTNPKATKGYKGGVKKMH